VNGHIKSLNDINNEYHKKNKSSTKGIGILVVVQALLQVHAKAASALIDIKDEFGKGPVISTNSVQFMIWMIYQIEPNSPPTALYLWFQFLFPLVYDASKNEFSDRIFTLLDKIITSRDSVAVDESIASMVYERILLYSATNKPPQPKWLQYKDKITDKKFLFKNPKKTDRKYFSMLLGHGATDNQILRDQVLIASTESLKNDPYTFKLWSEIYPKYIAQSSNLLYYITLNWDSQNLKKKVFYIFMTLSTTMRLT